jgi:hypothetical protein
LPRPLLDKTLRDLADRISRQANIAEAVMHSNAPDPYHVNIEHELRTMFDLLMESQLRSLREIEGLARLLVDRGKP